MEDISFYKSNGQAPHIIELTPNIYEQLAKSAFTKIGESVAKAITIDGEQHELELVELKEINRKQLKDFLEGEIVSESGKMLSILGDTPDKKEYQDASCFLRKLHELRKCVENEEYQYLQRVT